MSGTDPRSNTVRAVSRRALAIGFALVPLNAFYMIKFIYARGGDWHGVALFQNAVTVLFVIALVNLALKRWRPAWVLRPGEILIVYGILGMSNGLMGSVFSVGGSLPAFMTYPFRFASDENGWKDLLWPYLPAWLTVREPSTLKGFWEGEADPYAWSVIRAWASPALWWASFMGAVMWVCLCLNCIVRRRWSDEEKLAFPFVILPVHMVDERLGLFRSRLWWGAIVFSFALGVWNTIAGLIPSLPRIPVTVSVYEYLVNRWPWQALGNRLGVISWEPGFFGICYLMPVDLAFSLLIFDIFWLAEHVLSAHWGWDPAGGFPYISSQESGGLVGLALVFLWLDRRYFAQVIRRALGFGLAFQEEGREAFGYRTMVLGAIVGLGYLWWFWGRAGVPSGALLTFLALYFSVVIVLCRIRTQMGVPNHELWQVMPQNMMRTALGSLRLGPHTAAMFYLLDPYMVGQQDNNPAPLQLETLRMAEGGRMEPRRVAIAFALVAPLTVLCYFWAYIHFGYLQGMGSARTDSWQVRLAGWGCEAMAATLRQPDDMNFTSTLMMGFGAAVTWVLLFLKLRFNWWPLHPVAYPIASSWMIPYLTLIIFLTWIFKVLLLRYGGLRAHRTALPFFLGLIVGDFSAYFLRELAFQVFDVGM